LPDPNQALHRHSIQSPNRTDFNARQKYNRTNLGNPNERTNKNKMARLSLPLLAIILNLSTMPKAMAHRGSSYSLLSLSVPLSVAVFPSQAFANDDPEPEDDDDDFDDDDDEYDDDDDYEDTETAAEL